MKKSRLIIISTLIVTITTILIIILIPIFTLQISKIDEKLEKIEKTNNIRDANLLSDSIQRVKMSTTYGHYYILKGLNSSKASEFDSKLKIQIIDSISGLSDGDISKKELDKKSINELANILDKKSFDYVQIYNKDVEQIAELKLKRSNKEFWRNIWIIVIGIIQSIGLLLGFIANYKVDKSR